MNRWLDRLEDAPLWLLDPLGAWLLDRWLWRMEARVLDRLAARYQRTGEHVLAEWCEFGAANYRRAADECKPVWRRWRDHARQP